MKSCSSAFLLSLMVCCAGLWAQSAATSQISGVVTDQTGAVVSGAQVKLTQTDTGLVRTATSGPDGSYAVLSLPSGPYKLEVGKQGFSTTVQEGIVLQVNSNPKIDLPLNVGAVSDQVVVEAAASMVEAHTNSVGQVIDSRRVLELPLNGRNPTDLVFMVGAAAAAPVADLVSAKNYPGEQPISIAGGQATGATYTLDGGTHNDPFNNLALPLPFPDALQEFKVETSALPAQYGQHSGGAINAITKSGTNEYHGDLFEFVRNYKFNARSFFSPTRDSLKRNQFGGTIGAPIIEDKLFFFAGYQGTIIRSNPTSANGTVPTPDMVNNGNFSTIASKTCQTKPVQLYDPASSADATQRLPFAGNQIPVTSFSQPALNMLKFYPTPGDTACGKESFAPRSGQDEHMGIAKGDYQINSRQTVFLRYLVSHALVPTPYDGVNPLTMTSSGADDLVNSAVLGHTWVISPTMINAFRATFDRSAVTKTQTPTFDGPSLGIKMHTLVPGHIVISVTGGPSSSSIFSYPAFDPTTAFQLANDFTVIKGKHQFTFGGSWIRQVQYVFGPLNGDGVINFTGSQTAGPGSSGLGMADFLLGRTNTFQQGGVQYAYERYHSLGLYAQDNWKLTPHLTLNYGLRWEPYIGGSMPLGYVMHFDRALFDQNVHSSVYPGAPAGVLFPGDKGFDTNGRPSNTKLNDFAPRLGAVWDPKGNGRMTVRLSWGILYDMPHTLFAYGFSQAPPWAAVINLPTVSLADPWANYTGGDPFPFNLAKNATFPSFSSYTSYPLNIHVPYLQQWNLSVQKQIGANWLFSASYLGNSTIHLWAEAPLNAAVNMPGATVGNQNTRRVLYLANSAQGQYFGTVHQLDDGSTASYNAMLLSAQHRIASHFSVLGNYTFSHCISGPFTSELDGLGYGNPANRNFDRGNCVGIDHRHLANVTALQEAPKFSDKWMRALASDWKVSEIIRIQSGSFFSVASGVDSALNGNLGAQRPNYVGGDPYAGATCAATTQFCVPWLSTAPFKPATSGTYGNLGSANILGPGTFQIDMSLVRAFPVRERQRVEVRAEAFNLLNHYQPGNPSATFSTASTFGQITTGGQPRIMQFAFKYIF
jgi:hypothetical protein